MFTEANKRKFVFLFSSNVNVPVRTRKQTIQHALAARVNDVPAIFGVKGYAVAGTLSTYDYIIDSVADPMHCIWINLVLMFLEMWFSKANKVCAMFLLKENLTIC